MKAKCKENKINPNCLFGKAKKRKKKKNSRFGGFNLWIHYCESIVYEALSFNIAFLSTAQEN